ncbi:MAG: tripartite tricarboxylate transporter substrate binding protein [Vicinamibacterales bacterium]
MTFSRRRFLEVCGGAGMATAAGLGMTGIAEAQAQAYPGAQPVQWIIYQSPGGLVDTSSRTLQPYLAEQGVNTVFEYVRGASGRIARTQLFRGKPDGYAMMTEASPEEVLGEVVFNADYKVSEFQPVIGWFVNAFNLYVRKDSNIKTFDDFVKAARTRSVTIGTLGRGGPSHLQIMLLRKALNLNLQPVHFNGGAPTYAAVAGGHVEAAIGGSTSAKTAVDGRFLTVFRDGRDPALPDVPTVSELGFKIPSINEIIYINAGPGVPADRIQRLANAFTKAIENPEQIAKQKNIGVYPKVITAAELRKAIQAEYGFVTEYKSELAASS